MNKPTVWIQPGIVIINGSSLDAAPHSHHAIQVVCPERDSLCKINEINSSKVLIIDAKVEHQLQMTQGWVLLIEPKSFLGQELSIKLNGESLKVLEFELSPLIKSATAPENASALLSPLFEKLGLTAPYLPFNKTTVIDKRIHKLITELDQCLQGDCIKPSHWRANDIAKQLALSEGRFLHLFRQELGIAWRPYLLWRRMICAIKAMLNNASATDAAHLAGFSDSAHLSRTFRKNFGMSIRQAHALFKKN